jgi:DNA-binding NarL/FixJ family response regulator
MSDRIAVLLADDQLLFVESLKTVLETRASDLSIQDIAHNGLEAVEAVRRRQPDIVLMDIRMPVMDGVEATRIIHQEYPEVAIMMLTTFDDDEYVTEALKLGAAGYLLKDSPPNELIAAIRSLLQGSVIISPQVANKLLRIGDAEKRRDPAAETDPGLLKFLSRREIEILRLIGQGEDNTGIAERLFISEQTVKNHVSVIYSKLNIHNRIKVMQLADRFSAYLSSLGD